VWLLVSSQFEPQKKAGRFASNSGEDDWREVRNHSVEASEIPNNHLFGCQTTSKSNGYFLANSTSTGAGGGFVNHQQW